MLINTPSVTAVLGVIIPLLIFDVVVVVLRLCARHHLKQPLRADDLLMLPALMLVWVCAAILFYGINHKTMGYRVEVPLLQRRSDPLAADWAIVQTRRLEHAFFCIFLPALTLIKMSVLFLYRRLFVVHRGFSEPRNLVITAMIVLVAMWGTAYELTEIFACKLEFVKVFYDSELGQRVCINTFDVGYSFAISDFIMDALIIIIPVPLVWRLHLPLGQRLAVLAIFLMGILATVASAVRLAFSVWGRRVSYDPTFDEELNLTAELFWGLLEMTIALIAACLPTLRALVKISFVDKAMHSIRSALRLRSRSQMASVESTDSPQLYNDDLAALKQPTRIITKPHIVTSELLKAGSESSDSV